MDRPERTRSDQGWYRLPFELVQKSAAAIVPSAKFRQGVIDHNRYYVDLTSLNLNEHPQKIEEIQNDLLFPVAARPIFNEAFEKFGHLRFIGVGPSRGQIAYRLYVGWGEESFSEDHMATAIDWHPGAEDFAVKKYAFLGRLHKDKEREEISRCLGLEGDDVPKDAAVRVGKAVSAIIAKARGDLSTNFAMETDSVRRSVSFNYNFVAYTENNDIRKELEDLVSALNVPRDDYHRWRRFTDSLRILDVAVGTGADATPFVTFYHGLLREPPGFVQRDADRFAHADSLVKTLGSAEKLDSFGNTTPPVELGETGLVPAKERLTTKAEPTPNVALPVEPQKVYVLGQLVAHLPEEFRAIGFPRTGRLAQEDHDTLADFLNEKPFAAEAIHWTLSQQGWSQYSIKPSGAFAKDGYRILRDILTFQDGANGADFVLSGTLSGSRLTLGNSTLQEVIPDLAGLGPMPSIVSLPNRVPEHAETPRASLKSVADWVEVMASNKGLMDDERALNAVIFWESNRGRMMADLIHDYPAIKRAATRSLAVDGANSELASTIAVELTFFNPTKRMKRVACVHIDVSDTLPVHVFGPNFWSRP